MSAALHHVTAIGGPAARNLRFYTAVLGLRLVKKTVNFDDPGTYHLYYGDEAGRPGSILTFFPWDHAAPGRVGVGETSRTAFRVAPASIGWWMQRFAEAGVAHDAPVMRFGETTLAFRDPDGLSLALVGVEGAEGEPGRAGGAAPADHAIRGFHGVTLLLRDVVPTAEILENVFGHREVAREGAVIRYDAGGGPYGRYVDLHAAGDAPSGRPGAGSVHHVAFRAADDAAQAGMARKLVAEHRVGVTEQKDRQYFRSVYFREPGGVLFEIATDAPGFAVDEPAETLGQALKLPPGLESQRSRIERGLPALA